MKAKKFTLASPLTLLQTRRQMLLSCLALTAFASRSGSAGEVTRPVAHETRKPTGGPHRVMIDPGHGGIDPGAIGHQGAKEKHVVLAIANKVRDNLNQHDHIHTTLTREQDEFIPLFRRVELAQQHHADLFVSIHADGFTSPSAAGASVFALSNRGASSAMARYLSQKENAADDVAGGKYREQDNYLQQVLFDLVQTDTIKNSLTLGRHLLNHIRPIHQLHSQHTEQAAFAVLKSASIPSVLVETSFITNHHEERLLETSAFQERIALAISNGIVDFFASFDALQSRLAFANHR
ncbi:N-acetylmuramoyl-L-alanine amidase AmiA [Acerihabitans sp. TG2]|uniref:N-acetylmuramoyl-L-alanine amidase AmiA n=1 Tax=Acerihabitans sp. TG2 TaxID=3096008 RepID=UPI002B228B84|nr:N-acetylmuramoyl-L-alanine amidase AmiA [Acerihabitans sp. TG2]MEA9389034.1 N-acetylmuramoyl-L-alanine amidase AmiA [Acerihabitans sp. TG2]